MARQCRNFIESFEKYLSLVESPPQFKTWSALTCVSGALERRCWSTNRKGQGRSMHVFPTLMVFVIGDTASGKSPPINLCRELWKAVPKLRVGEDSQTAASFYDAITESRKLLDIGTHTLTHPLAIAADEMASFFIDYDKELLAAFIQAYDCKHELSQRRRGGQGVIRLDNPCLNLLMGGQPGMFPTFFPEQAFHQGFMRRAIVVYGEKKSRMPFFQLTQNDDADTVDHDTAVGDALRHDLGELANLSGPFVWAPDAIEKFNAWDSSREDWPTHPRMDQYNEHRTVHCAKIAMLLSAAESDNRVIDIRHFNEALSLLRAVEIDMPKVLQATISDNDYRMIEATLDHLKSYVRAKGDNVVHESVIYDFLIRHIMSNKVPIIIEAMIGARELQIISATTPRQRLFKLRGIDQFLDEEDEEKEVNKKFSSIAVPDKA